MTGLFVEQPLASPGSANYFQDHQVIMSHIISLVLQPLLQQKEQKAACLAVNLCFLYKGILSKAATLEAGKVSKTMV